MTSSWVRLHLKSPASRVFAQPFVQGWIKTPKLHVTGICEGNPPVTGDFPPQRVTNVENVLISWRHHGWFNLAALTDIRWIILIVFTSVEILSISFCTVSKLIRCLSYTWFPIVSVCGIYVFRRESYTWARKASAFWDSCTTFKYLKRTAAPK